MDNPTASNREILLFSMQEEVGALARALKIFEVQYPYVNLNGNPFLSSSSPPRLFPSCCHKSFLVFFLPSRFQDNKVNLLHIESRSSKRSIGDYEFIVEIDTVSGDVAAAIEGLKKQSSYFQIISRDHKDGNGSN
jgi:phenylalanine-4-hydroxylase